MEVFKEGETPPGNLKFRLKIVASPLLTKYFLCARMILQYGGTFKLYENCSDITGKWQVIDGQASGLVKNYRAAFNVYSTLTTE